MNFNRTLAALAAACTLTPAFASAADLTVQVTGLEEASGTIYVALFDEAGWSTNSAVGTARIDVTDAAPSAQFDGLAPGTYGVKLFQDLNGDGELALGNFGIPSEPYGFSNDAPVRFGPPRFSDAGFERTETGASQSITLR